MGWVVSQSKWDSSLGMKDRMFNWGIAEDLMKNRFHPWNLHKFKGWGFGFDDDDDIIEYDTYEEWLKQ